MPDTTSAVCKYCKPKQVSIIMKSRNKILNAEELLCERIAKLEADNARLREALDESFCVMTDVRENHCLPKKHRQGSTVKSLDPVIERARAALDATGDGWIRIEEIPYNGSDEYIFVTDKKSAWMARMRPRNEWCLVTHYQPIRVPPPPRVGS